LPFRDVRAKEDFARLGPFAVNFLYLIPRQDS
jgi:hypothetical protein